MRAAAGLASHTGEYCVRKRAIAIENGTATTRATIDVATVAHRRSTMPNDIGELVFHVEEVKKLAWLADRAGPAWATRKTATRVTMTMTVRPAPVAATPNSRSPSRPVLALSALSGWGSSGLGVSSTMDAPVMLVICCCLSRSSGRLRGAPGSSRRPADLGSP